MLKNPEIKYRPFQSPVDLPDRKWPSNKLTQAPRWLSTDLRDGNQALADPMDVERKLRFYNMLLGVGFKEIEVAFPSASQTEFDFVRALIEENRVPDDVTIQVLTQSRVDLIARTFESLDGVRQAIVHLYNATAPLFRRVVFGMDLPLATHSASLPNGMCGCAGQLTFRLGRALELGPAESVEVVHEISLGQGIKRLQVQAHDRADRIGPMIGMLAKRRLGHREKQRLPGLVQ